MSCPLLGADVRTKIGVLVTVASMIASAPTSWWYRNVNVQEEKHTKKSKPEQCWWNRWPNQTQPVAQ
jgi:hypothetical protein